LKGRATVGNQLNEFTERKKETGVTHKREFERELHFSSSPPEGGAL